MPSISNGESGLSVRTKLNALLEYGQVNYASRDLLVEARAANPDWPLGAVLSDGEMLYVVMPAGHTAYGTDPIADLPGCAPFMAGAGDGHLYHFVASTVTDADTITAAGQALIDYAETLGGADTNGAKIFFPSAELDVTATGTVTVLPLGPISYVWTVQKALNIEGMGVEATEFHVQSNNTVLFYVGGDDPFNNDKVVGGSFRDFTAINDSGSAGAAGGYAILLDRSQADVENVRGRNFYRTIGNFGAPESARVTSCDLETTLSQSVAAGSAMLFLGRRRVLSSIGGATQDTSEINYDAETSAFTVGQTLTGGTSGATATIERVFDYGTTGTLGLSSISGTFVDDEALTDGAGGAAVANGAVGVNYYIEPNTVFIDNTNMRPGALTGYLGAQYTVLAGCGDGVHLTASHVAWGEEACIAFIPEQASLGKTTLQMNAVHFDPLPVRTGAHGIYAADLNNVGSTTMSELRITACDVSGADGDAIHLDLDIQGVQITGSGSRVTGGRAIYMRGVSDFIINGFIARNSDQNGNDVPTIELETCTRGSVDNVNMNDFYDGIYVHSDCVDVNIGSNIIAQNKVSGGTTIYLESGADAWADHGARINESLNITAATQIRIPVGYDHFFVQGASDIWEILMDSPTSGFKDRTVWLTFASTATLKDDGGTPPGAESPNLRIGADISGAQGTVVGLKYDSNLSKWIAISNRANA